MISLEGYMLTAREQLVREVERLLGALEVGLRMLKQHFPAEYEQLKKNWGSLWN